MSKATFKKGEIQFLINCIAVVMSFIPINNVWFNLQKNKKRFVSAQKDLLKGHQELEKRNTATDPSGKPKTKKDKDRNGEEITVPLFKDQAAHQEEVEALYESEVEIDVHMSTMTSDFAWPDDKEFKRAFDAVVDVLIEIEPAPERNNTRSIAPKIAAPEKEETVTTEALSE